MNNQRNTPLVRPTTVGRSLLDFFGAPSSRSAAARPMQSGLLSSPQDFRQPSMGRDLMAMLGGPKTNPLSKLKDYELVEIANFGDLALANAATRELQLREPRGLLGSESIRPATSESMNVASEPSPEFSVQSDFAPLPRPSLPRDSMDEIERQSVPTGILSKIGQGVRGAGQELAGLFKGPEGQLRARELSKALMTGPSRTPISFGQSLVEGLSAGGEAISNVEAARKAALINDMKSALELEKLSIEIEEKRKQKNGDSRKKEKTLSVISSIDDAVEIVDDYGRLAAGVGSLSKFLPETPARRLELALDSVKANIGFEALQQMRDASKTGGALGQVTERELEFLQRTIAPIEADLSPEDLRRNLMKVRVSMLATAYGVVDSKTGEVRRIESASDYNEILKGNLRVNYEDETAGGEPSGSAVKTFNPETGEFEEINARY